MQQHKNQQILPIPITKRPKSKLPNGNPKPTPTLKDHLTYLKEKYDKKNTHKTINDHIQNHINLIKQCDNDDEIADVLYTLYTTGIRQGIQSILKSFPTK